MKLREDERLVAMTKTEVFSTYLAGVDLQPNSYQYVANKMLCNQTELPSAACDINRLGAAPSTSESDTSFIRQVQSVTYEPTTLGEQFTTPPDAFVFTLKSAVPVADCVRGFFDAIGLERPLIEVVESNRDLSKGYYELLDRTDDKEFAKETALQEADRLRDSLQGAEHVCVVDQFVCSGMTLKLAGEILKMAGLRNISAIRGDWYHDAYSYDVIPASATSLHRQFMYGVGARCG